MERYAHISEDGKRFQTVKCHLENTARIAGDFAASFDAANAAKFAGMLHDIGKYSDAFQKRLQGGVKVDHSTAGMQEALKMGNIPVAFAIAGHHSGIPDGGNRTDTEDEKTLFGRSKRKLENYSEWSKEIIAADGAVPDWVNRDFVTSDFFTRMLYSCLVDADFIDTETFMNGEPLPRGEGRPLRELYPKVAGRAERYLSNAGGSEVAKQRNQVLQACVSGGRNGAQGLYTLTVPTGGGKTFSSLAFAMEHVLAQNMKRIIYVIPYTSIIDQTVQVFEELLGEENVLAHYSTADYRLVEREDMTDQQYRHLLSCENWDAPVIVTTAVQFFESLYSNRSSQCRKLHNIADSVVIFDEAQTIPNDYLLPCVSAISQLIQHYHTTAVLCTATQPVLDPFFKKIGNGIQSREIVPDRERLYQTLKRSTICDIGSISAADMGKRLTETEQVLCVVNRRKTAQELYAELPMEGSYCLTTLLCAFDRRRQLSEIRERLREGLPCRVVSTSLIEAGVDVDFPIVYRETVGLDQLIQTAGRCNREGKRSVEKSLVYSFQLEEIRVPQQLQQNVDAAHYVMRCTDQLDSLEAIRIYFGELYANKGEASFDKKGILDAVCNGINGCIFPFEQIADKFKLIETSARTIYIPIDDGQELCQRLKDGYISRALWRRLGIFSVQCYEEQFNALDQAGALALTKNGDAILTDLSRYSRQTGLSMDIETGVGVFF